MGYYYLALKRAGYQVECASSVKEAKRILDAEKFDLILLDIMMPRGEYTAEETASGMRTGFCLARTIKSTSHDELIAILSNAVPQGGSPGKDLEELLEDQIVTKAFFKPDTTPFMLVELVDSLLLEITND